MRAPAHLLVELKKKYDDEIVFDSGVKLFIDPSFRPEWHVSCSGIAVSDGWGVKAGDEVLFSYKIVGDVTFESDPAAFYRVTKQEGFRMEWANQNKETLILQAGMKKGQWSGIWLDKWGDLLQGTKGTQGQVENWATGNFKFMSSEGFSYNNLLHWDDKEYWKVDPTQIFAVRRKEGWRAVAPYLIIEPIVELVPEVISLSIEHTQGGKFRLAEDKGWVRAVKGVSGLSNGDVVRFDPTIKQRYQIEGKPMYVLHQDFLLAKEVA